MSLKRKILFIEDQIDLASTIQMQGDLFGYRIVVASDGIRGWRAIEEEKPDLLLLDLLLPGENGLDICRKVKLHPKLKSIPTMILSAKKGEIDIILGLELGADDYVTKPFSPKVLFAKIKALLRRSLERKISPTIQFGDFTLEIDHFTLHKGNQEISLTLSEFGILKKLATHRGKVFARSLLLNEIQNDDTLIFDRNVDVHIASLRKKLGPQFSWIETVRGVGYRFRKEASSV